MVDKTKNAKEQQWAVDKEAFTLIDELGQKLLALTKGEKLPSHWITRWKKAIAPTNKKAGRQEDIEKIEKLAKARIVNRVALATNTRDKKPGQVKQEIADEIGVSTRTVERSHHDMDAILAMEQSGEANPEMSYEKRQAIISGIAKGIDEDLNREDEKIQEAKRKQAEKWMRTHGIQIIEQPSSSSQK